MKVAELLTSFDKRLESPVGESMYIPGLMYVCVKVCVCRGRLITPSGRHWGQLFLFLWATACCISYFWFWFVEITACNGTYFFIVKSRNGALLEENIV